MRFIQVHLISRPNGNVELGDQDRFICRELFPNIIPFRNVPPTYRVIPVQRRKKLRYSNRVAFEPFLSNLILQLFPRSGGRQNHHFNV